MFSRVMYVTLVVNDQDKALEFYTQMMGFEKRVDYKGSEGRFLTIGYRGQQPEVLLWHGTQERASESGAPASVSHGALFLESDDLAEDFERLRSQGVTLVEAEPETYPFGLRATAFDPDGNRVFLRQSRTP